MPQKQRSGIRLKKGVRSVLSLQYITRTRALKKLHLSLGDFRYLCIVKGVFPSVPESHSSKTKKIYYNLKDINYIAHDPLLQKLRDMKIFKRKLTRLVNRQEKDLAKNLATRMPEFNLDHLIKERYPTFIDALRDVDDALSLIYMYNSINIDARYIDIEHTSMVTRIIKEWSSWVFHAKALKKVFVSIKGYYFQAEIKNHFVTWLVPHTVVHMAPSSVDYRIINTFLFFYETLMRFVNFKLYKDEELAYPPEQIVTDDIDVKQLFKNKNKTSASKKIISNSIKSIAVSEEALSKDAAEALSNENVNQDEIDLEKFADIDKESLPILSKVKKSDGVFSGLVFLIGREVPHEQISFVIRCGGGLALPEMLLPPKHHNSPKITHQIVDRPSLTSDFILSRKYIQPQWVFDSFNERLALPIPPYAPGQDLPPHLSPFVNDVEEGYIPEQRNKLRLWVGLEPILLEDERKPENEIDNEDEEEEMFTEQVRIETEGLDDRQEVEQTIEIIGDSDSESEHESDEDDEEDEEIESIPKPAHPKAFDSRDNEREFAKLMLSNKKKRKLAAYENEDRAKQAKAAALTAKRRALQASNKK